MGTTAGLAVAALAPQRVARAGRRVYVPSDGARSWTRCASPRRTNDTRLAYAADGSVLLWGPERPCIARRIRAELEQQRRG